MIPQSVVYRIFGDTVAVVMHVPTRQILLLQHGALHLWNRLARGEPFKPTTDEQPLYEDWIARGLITTPGQSVLSPPRPAPQATAAKNLDLGVLNYWAFRNRIPLSGHFELTGRCNLRCQHCYCLFDHPRDTLNTEKILQIVDDLQQAGTMGLVLTGGEVFVRHDILDILSHLQARRFVLRINTNGTHITETVVGHLAAMPNIFRIHISLYGSSPELHDAITRSPGSHRKTIFAIHRLHEAGIPLRINCSLMQTNFDDLHNLKREMTDRLGIPVHFDPFIFPMDDGSTKNRCGELTDEQHALFNQHLDAQHQEQTHQKPPAKPKLCKAGFSFFSICEDGRLYPCLKMKRFYQNPLGNLATERFATLWRTSPQIQTIRRAMEHKLRECAVCDLTV